MSQVQLQVRPRRVRCSESCEPPPFRFETAHGRRERATGAALVALVPAKGLWLLLRTVGHAIDAAFFLATIVVWCALHLTVWSYAFEMGPAASCFGLPCPEWLRAKVVLACVALCACSFIAAMVLRRLNHRATGSVLLVLVTFDIAALLLLALNAAA
ncbi:MAG: hypothetical protein JWM86_1585 [Thermoleophilia bacterium]|nr:hypothetical protein [Thermoleophilia bacterium]